MENQNQNGGRPFNNGQQVVKTTNNKKKIGMWAGIAAGVATVVTLGILGYRRRKAKKAAEAAPAPEQKPAEETK